MSGTSKRHYVAMAAELRSTRATVEYLGRSTGFVGVTKTKGMDSVNAILDDITRAVAHVFASDNPAFDWDRFVRAADMAVLREVFVTEDNS